MKALTLLILTSFMACGSIYPPTVDNTLPPTPYNSDFSH